MRSQVERARLRWVQQYIIVAAIAVMIGIVIGWARARNQEDSKREAARARSEATERSLTAQIGNLLHDLQSCRAELQKPERRIDARTVVLHWLYPGVESYGKPMPWQEAVQWVKDGRDDCYRNGCVVWLEDVKPPPAESRQFWARTEQELAQRLSSKPFSSQEVPESKDGVWTKDDVVFFRRLSSGDVLWLRGGDWTHDPPAVWREEDLTTIFRRCEP